MEAAFGHLQTFLLSPEVQGSDDLVLEFQSLRLGHRAEVAVLALAALGPLEAPVSIAFEEPTGGLSRHGPGILSSTGARCHIPALNVPGEAE